MEIDREVARLWLESHKMVVDHLTKEQSDYLNSWS